ADLSGRWMAEHVDVGVLDRGDDACGLLLLRERESRVDGRDDVVKFLEHLVGVVHFARLDNVALRPEEDREALEAAVQLADAVPALEGVFRGQTPRDR